MTRLRWSFYWLCLVAVAYLPILKLVKNKPKTKGNDSLDDYDYGEEDSRNGKPKMRSRMSLTLTGGSTEEDDEDSVK